MSDQTTISSAEDSSSGLNAADATTTTTPPTGESRKDLGSLSAQHTQQQQQQQQQFDDLLANLSLVDDPSSSSLFSTPQPQSHQRTSSDFLGSGGAWPSLSQSILPDFSTQTADGVDRPSSLSPFYQTSTQSTPFATGSSRNNATNSTNSAATASTQSLPFSLPDKDGSSNGSHSPATLGPPLLGETARRLKYPTDDMLSIGMNYGSSLGFNSNFDSFQNTQAAYPAFVPQAGYRKPFKNQRQRQQPIKPSTSTMQPVSPQQTQAKVPISPSLGQRFAGTANVHRKHTSGKRRGEDAAKYVNASLADFLNEIYYLCKDQHGCRFLQRQLEIGGPDAATKIFNEIQLNVIELMIDPFGNYLVQKLLERVNEEQRTTLVRNASSQFVRIALDPHGTRALQKLIECIDSQEEFDIVVNSLSSYVVLLSRDLNGNHVIQKCLQRLPPESCDFIFEAACDNCVKIAKHRHGCCVLQRCFDHGITDQCEKLSLKVGEHCVELSVDPYGNYVVQYVLSMEEARLRSQTGLEQDSATTSQSIELIIKALSGSLVKLSTHKFGSNVVEKSLRIPTLAPSLINQLLKQPEALGLLLHDAYGNYVLQTTLDVADDASFKRLSEILKPCIPDVHNTPHGRRIMSKLISRGGATSSLGVQLPPVASNNAPRPYRPKNNYGYARSYNYEA